MSDITPTKADTTSGNGVDGGKLILHKSSAPENAIPIKKPANNGLNSSANKAVSCKFAHILFRFLCTYNIYLRPKSI